MLTIGAPTAEDPQEARPVDFLMRAMRQALHSLLRILAEMLWSQRLFRLRGDAVTAPRLEMLQYNLPAPG